MAHERQLIFGDATSTTHRLDPSSSPRGATALRRWGAPTALAGVTVSMVLLVVAVSQEFAPTPAAVLAILLLMAGTAAALRTFGRDERRATHADIVGMLGARVVAAEAAHERKEEILHELKASVGGVAMASRLLTEHGAQLEGDTVTRLEDMRVAELSRLQRLLAQEAAPIEPVDTDEVARTLAVSLTSRGHRVSCRTTTGRRALGRRDDVAEILHILLENAARHAPGSAIAVRSVGDEERLLVTVSDTGPGVPVDLRSRIFDRGERAASSPGQGIGLHAARRLAVEMGGDLRLESHHHESGATFVLELPAEPEEQLCHARSA